MRWTKITLLALFLVAPAVSATDAKPAEAELREVTPAVAVSEERTEAPALLLEQVSIEERATADDAAAAQVGPRGSFWWMVAVVVVAGVILAVVL